MKTRFPQVAIYTCFDMIEDCRAGKRQGWAHFTAHFAPACRFLMRHYGEGAGLEATLLAFRDDPASPVKTAEPMTEREFATLCRDFLVRKLAGGDDLAQSFELEPFTGALAELTATEKQILWLSLMDYGVGDIGDFLRVTPETVEQLLIRASELLAPASLDLEQLRARFVSLQAAVAAAPPEEPMPPKRYLDIIDGRQTWSQRHDFDKYVTASWHEVDHFCRIRETDRAMRKAEPLSAAESESLMQALGFGPEPQKGFWKRLVSN